LDEIVLDTRMPYKFIARKKNASGPEFFVASAPRFRVRVRVRVRVSYSPRNAPEKPQKCPRSTLQLILAAARQRV